MPTYRNNSDIAITYNTKGGQYSFPPHKNYEATVWVPYQELGLELVNPDYPPVPESILLSGKFTFEKGLERKFSVKHCEKYRLKMSVSTGRVKLYMGSSKMGIDVSGDYECDLDWGRAPFVRVVGLDPASDVRVHAEVID